jgi:hypothetical protein
MDVDSIAVSWRNVVGEKRKRLVDIEMKMLVAGRAGLEPKERNHALYDSHQQTLVVPFCRVYALT